jgi:hypothetical protein
MPMVGFEERISVAGALSGVEAAKVKHLLLPVVECSEKTHTKKE